MSIQFKITEENEDSYDVAAGAYRYNVENKKRKNTLEWVQAMKEMDKKMAEQGEP
jgi:hypothetical protein